MTKADKDQEHGSDLQERLRTLAVDTWQIALYEHDHLTNKFYGSPLKRKFYGFTPDEELTVAKFGEAFYPDDREDMLEAIRRAHDPSGNGDYDKVHRIIRADGSLRWLHTRGTTTFGMIDGKRVALRSTGSVMDITHVKDLEEQMRHAQRMEAIGRLAGGIAHDFNNLLFVVMGFASLAVARLQPEQPGRREMEEIQRAAERAAALTGQLLAFGRKQILQPRVLDVCALVKDSVPMLRQFVGEHLELGLELPPEPRWIKADPNQVEQILLNLVVNARDALGETGKVEIAVGREGLTDEVLAASSALPAGDYVTVRVTDTGAGMAPETLSRIFEPFFTTKPRGKGSGLGLSTVFGIVSQSGGTVTARSELGKGSTFTVYLPATQEAISEPTVEQERIPLAVGGTVLVAEDVAQVRAMVCDVLESAGYRVLRAAGGDEALAQMESHGDAVDLLLTDVVMPEMGGKQLVERVLKRWPGTPIIYMSGYTEDSIVNQGVLEGGVEFLPKPLTVERLLHKVASMIGRRSHTRSVVTPSSIRTERAS